MTPRAKWLVGGAAAAVLLLIAVSYTVVSANRRTPAAASQVSLAAGRFYFRDIATNRLGSVPTTDPGSERTISDLECARFSATTTIAVCLTNFEVLVVDAGLRERRRTANGGTPSRARVSASGRMISWTGFSTGDSYVGSSGFSTRTGILDTATGRVRANIEDLALTIGGKPYSSVDVNYWGVTFTSDDNTFYATVATKGKTHLVRGDTRTWTATTLRENVECPSLSPDNTRLAFKKRVSSDPKRPWRLHVLDLATMRETQLAEEASIDDQAIWQDDRTLAYERDDSIYSVPADGTGQPKLLIRDADSPALIPGG